MISSIDNLLDVYMYLTRKLFLSINVFQYDIRQTQYDCS